MNAFKLYSVLLAYPSQELQDAIRQIVADQQLAIEPQNDALDAQALLQPLLSYLAETDIISVQENYVATFDRNPSHSLHLFEHLHGEDRQRGDAMVNLLHEYQKQGFEPQGYELPDYLPLFLEFLSLQASDQQATALLNEAVHVIHYVENKLAEHESIYANVLRLVVSLATVEPQALTVAPVRDMDEALEVFGPTIEGIEPLLKPTLHVDDVQIVKLAPSPSKAKSVGAKT